MLEMLEMSSCLVHRDLPLFTWPFPAQNPSTVLQSIEIFQHKTLGFPWPDPNSVFRILLLPFLPANPALWLNRTVHSPTFQILSLLLSFAFSRVPLTLIFPVKYPICYYSLIYVAKQDRSSWIPWLLQLLPKLPLYGPPLTPMKEFPLGHCSGDDSNIACLLSFSSFLLGFLRFNSTEWCPPLTREKHGEILLFMLKTQWKLSRDNDC